MSMTNTSPQSFLGGTWTQIAQGRTLVGVNTNETEFNTVNKTGGSKTVTLTVDQIPSHAHGARYLGSASGPDMGWYGNGGTINSSILTANSGGGKAHTNLQPYLTVYIWKRTA